MKRTDNPPDPDTRFEGADSGRTLTYRQIGFIGWKAPTSIERADDGFVVDGEQFTLINDSWEPSAGLSGAA